MRAYHCGFHDMNPVRSLKMPHLFLNGIKNSSSARTAQSAYKKKFYLAKMGQGRRYLKNRLKFFFAHDF